MAIWKFGLEIEDKQIIRMPLGAEPLCVKVQRGRLCLWAFVDRDADNEDARLVRIVGTGHPFLKAERDTLQYVGTAMMLGDNLVWHVFIEKR
jgi:hypothetical protein